MLSLVDLRPSPPCPASFNMARYVLSQAQVTPDKIALQILRVTGAERWSYAALERAVRGIGTGLLQAGLVPGDRLLLRLGNTIDFPLAFLAALAVGIVPVPTSSQLTQREITAMATPLAPAAVLVAEGIARPDLPLRMIDAQTMHEWRTFPPCDWAMGDPDRLGYMVFTSGTSGSPRAVMHAHRAVWARRMMWDGWYGLRSEDRVLHAGAFNWTYTLGTGLMDPWAIGATALIPDPAITPIQLPLLLKRFDATIFAAAPGVYRQMLKSPILSLPKLRHGLSAGERLPDVTRTAWVEATGTPIHEALGMSEVSTFVSSNPAHPAPAGVSGYAQPGRRIAVLGPDGQPVPRGAAGVLAVDRNDPGLFLGYFGAEAETRARHIGPWFMTGDTVSMAEDGAIRYLGRDDDMLNAGGFRVSPLEIEAVFDTHPQIAESAAIEISPRDGVSVIALCYVPRDGAAPDAATLHTFAAERLARYKQPRVFHALEALPKGPNGKLSRKLLRSRVGDRQG